MTKTNKIIIFIAVILVVVALVKLGGHEYSNAGRLFLKNLWRQIF